MNELGSRLAHSVGAGRLLGLLVLMGAVALRVWDPPALEMLRLKIFDLYQIAKPREAADYPVVIVDIDEKSMQQLGQWPWPRTVVADLVTALKDLGARAIGFDALFAEPDRLSPRLVADVIKQADPETRRQLRSMPDNETYLVEAIKGAPVVLGQAGHSARTHPLSGNQPAIPVATLGGDPRQYLVEFPGLIRNLPDLEAAATGRGLFTVRPELDGIIRRVPLVMSAESRVMPALSLEVLRVAHGVSTFMVRRDDAGVKSIGLGSLVIPTDRHGQLWLRYTRHDRNRFVSAADVLGGTAPADRIRGKLVLIGTTAVGLFDLRSTPVEAVMPGVEIHAQAIENILSNAAIYRPNYVIGAELSLAALVGLAIIVLVPMLGAVPVLVLGGLIAMALAAGSWALYDLRGILIDVMFPLASSLAIFLLLTFINYVREERQKAQIRTAFAQYLSPELVSELTRNPKLLVLGGQTRELSILFSDVRGFTAIAETFKQNPSGLTALMNRFLTPLSKAVIDRRGTIDKYMGDAIMAFWNAPLDDPAHPLHACEAALAMVKEVDTLNRERQLEAEASGKPFLRMEVGIGISTGVSVVGNMGSDIRFDYSVLGDSVNLASRLEGLTTMYGVRILVASETARRGAAHLATLEIDTVRVKGKREPETVFAIVGGAEFAQSPAFAALRDAFYRMLEAYRRQEWQTVRAQIADCRHRGDAGQLGRLLDLYESRVEELERTPPGRDWDGVYTATSKGGHD